MPSFNNTYSTADANVTSSDPSRDIFHDEQNVSSHSSSQSTNAHSHSHSHATPTTNTTDNSSSSNRNFEGQGGPGAEAGGITKSGVQGGDSFDQQPGSTTVSDHRHTVDPSNVDVSIGSKGDSVYQPREESAASGGGPVSYSGGEGTGTNNTIPGGVKGTGGMGKRDGEDAMGGGGGVVGKIAEKLHMGHGNK